MTDTVKPALRRHLKEQRRQARLWDDSRRPLDPGRRSLPVDYLLSPGTVEGDAATAERRARWVTATRNVKATREYLDR